MLVSSAKAQSAPAEALRGQGKKITVAELPPSYRAVVLGQSEFGGVYGLMGMGNSNNEQSLMLYGLLGSAFVDPDEFAALLDGKLPRIRAYTLDLASMARKRTADDTSTMPNLFFTESWVEAGRVSQWSPRPELTRDAILKVFGEPGAGNPQADIARTLSNAKQVAIAITLYTTDTDDLLPYAHSTAEAQKQVEPYTQNAGLWKSYNPNGGRLLYNTTLSGVSVEALESLDKTPLLWDEKPWPDGRRVVAYVDGHAQVVTANQWNGTIWPAELRRREQRRQERMRPATGKWPIPGREPRPATSAPHPPSGVPRTI